MTCLSIDLMENQKHLLALMKLLSLAINLLHSLNPTGLPPYMLHLKENCPIILLRNLNPCEGLCNRTRLTCCDFRTRVFSTNITTRDFKNTRVFIPRIPLVSSQR